MPRYQPQRFTGQRDSFDTLYSALKVSDGGKGFGRFTCLKYFERMSVESVFRDGAAFKTRSFDMGTGNDIIINESVANSGVRETGSKVTVKGSKSVKFSEKVWTSSRACSLSGCCPILSTRSPNARASS